MTAGRRTLFVEALLYAGLPLVVWAIVGAGSARAAVQYLNDGAVQDPTTGTWDPPQSSAVLGLPGGPANLGRGYCYPDVTKLTRPDCLALRYPYATSAACTADASNYGSIYSGGYNGVNTSPNVLTFTSGTCNYPDAAGSASQAACTAVGFCSNVLYSTQATCVANGGLWTQEGQYTNGVCALTMKGYDRNRVTCFNLGGTWVATACTGTWVMPNSSTYTPPLFTGTTSPGPGDQCQRCHNGMTQWNVNRARDVGDTILFQGHKNMSRKVVAGKSWSGPPFTCSDPLFTAPSSCQANGDKWIPANASYPTDSSGHPIDWVLGNISINSVSDQLYWIYGGWGLDGPALPGAIYSAPASTTQVCSDPRYTNANCVMNGGTLVFNAGASYSCARCHATGWTSDATIGPSSGNLAKEPEKSFPGITWNHTSNAGTGVVNLAGGVTGDPNMYGSWDLFGIDCSRCHSSAVDNTSNGGVPPYSSAAGQSSHHNALDTPDAGSGYCTDPRFTAQTQCQNNGGTWLTACSDGVSTTQSACQAISGNTWFVSYCTLPTSYTFPSWWTGGINAVTVNSGGSGYSVGNVLTVSGGTGGTASVTTVSSGVITALSLISAGAGYSTATNVSTTGGSGTGATVNITVPTGQGTCSNATYTDAPTCVQHNATWTNQWATDIDSCEDAGGKWTGSKPIKGQIITALCMQCHRQETGGLPYTNGTCSVNPATNTNQSACLSNSGVWTETGNGLPVEVGPSGNTVSFGNHPQGNEYLNSPHGLFTGKFSQIASGTVKFDNTGIYKSFFLNDGEAANAGNGCTGCHNIHKSVVQAANPDGGALVSSPSGIGGAVTACNDCHHKNLGRMLHPKGIGTPLENLTSDPTKACATCHMPDALHLFRINTDPNYSTFPSSAFGLTSGVVNAATAPDGLFNNAVWVDLDAACGQCHGGGTANATTKGSITAGSKTLCVANPANFSSGQRVTIAGASSSAGQPADFPTYVASGAPGACATGTPVLLVGAAATGVTNATVTLNPTANNAAYMTKAQLASFAAGIHNDTPESVNFGYTLGRPNTLIVDVFASASCSGGSCNNYDWNWGDGTPDTSGATATAASHTYADGGAYQITLTVEEFGFGTGSASKIVSVYTADLPPTVGGLASSCSSIQTSTTPPSIATNWTASFTDSSSDDNGVSQVTVNWGDGSLLGVGGKGTVFSHAYGGPGTYTMTHTALDTIGQQKVELCTVTLKYFTISGTVNATITAATDSTSCTAAGGTWNGSTCTIAVASATVTMTGAATGAIRTVYTAVNGMFSAGSLRPDTYTLTVANPMSTFTSPAAVITVGPSSVGNTIPGTQP